MSKLSGYFARAVDTVVIPLEALTTVVIGELPLRTIPGGPDSFQVKNNDLYDKDGHLIYRGASQMMAGMLPGALSLLPAMALIGSSSHPAAGLAALAVPIVATSAGFNLHSSFSAAVYHAKRFYREGKEHINENVAPNVLAP